MYYSYARGANGDRFIVPFLLGGLTGGALVGVTRPRPVYVTGAQNYPSYPPRPPYMPPYQGGYYSNSFYGYY